MGKVFDVLSPFLWITLVAQQGLWAGPVLTSGEPGCAACAAPGDRAEMDYETEKTASSPTTSLRLRD